MSMSELFVPMAGMLMIVTITALITRLISASVLNRTIREAMRSDPGSVPLLAERLEPRPLWGDYLLGWIFLALAAGLVLLGVTEEDNWESRQMLRSAIIPAIVGLTVLGYSWFARRGAR